MPIAGAVEELCFCTSMALSHELNPTNIITSPFVRFSNAFTLK